MFNQIKYDRVQMCSSDLKLETVAAALHRTGAITKLCDGAPESLLQIYDLERDVFCLWNTLMEGTEENSSLHAAVGVKVLYLENNPGVVKELSLIPNVNQCSGSLEVWSSFQ